MSTTALLSTVYMNDAGYEFIPVLPEMVILKCLKFYIVQSMSECSSLAKILKTLCKRCKMSVLLYKFRLFFTVKCEPCCNMLSRKQTWDIYNKISLEQCT